MKTKQRIRVKSGDKLEIDINQANAEQPAKPKPAPVQPRRFLRSPPVIPEDDLQAVGSPRITVHAANIPIVDANFFGSPGITDSLIRHGALESLTVLPSITADPESPPDYSPTGLDIIPRNYVRGGLTGHSPTIWDVEDLGYRKIPMCFQIHPLVPTGYDGLQVSTRGRVDPLVGDARWKFRAPQFPQEADELYYPPGYAGIQYTLRPAGYLGKKALISNGSPYFEDFDWGDTDNFKCTTDPHFSGATVQAPKIKNTDTVKLILFPRLWLWTLKFTEWWRWASKVPLGGHNVKQCWTMKRSQTAMTGPGDPQSDTGSVTVPAVFVSGATSELDINDPFGIANRVGLHASFMFHEADAMINGVNQNSLMASVTGLTPFTDADLGSGENPLGISGLDPGSIAWGDVEDVTDGHINISLDTSHAGTLVSALELNGKSSTRTYLWGTQDKANAGTIFDGNYFSMHDAVKDVNFEFGFIIVGEFQKRWPSTFPNDPNGTAIILSPWRLVESESRVPSGFGVEFTVGC